MLGVDPERVVVTPIVTLINNLKSPYCFVLSILC
jgi:hypothetical protein